MACSVKHEKSLLLKFCDPLLLYIYFNDIFLLLVFGFHVNIALDLEN